jgi:hypothetical protein
MMKPRTIFVQPQEDVDEISAKIRSSKNDSVALVIPLNAVLFQSIISVKILRNNAEKEKKKISIITRDSRGRSFAEQLGIPNAPDMEHLQLPTDQKITLPPKKNLPDLPKRSVLDLFFPNLKTNILP